MRACKHGEQYVEGGEALMGGWNCRVLQIHAIKIAKNKKNKKLLGTRWVLESVFSKWEEQLLVQQVDWVSSICQV